MVKRLDKWNLTNTVLKLYEGHLCLRDFKLPEFMKTAQNVFYNIRHSAPDEELH